MVDKIFFDVSRCGNDSDGNPMEWDDEMERGVSNDVCKAIGQVSGKWKTWAEKYLATCSDAKRARPLAKFTKMEANMKRAAGCNKQINA